MRARIVLLIPAVVAALVAGLIAAAPAYAAAPAITSFTPTSGPLLTSVAITGTGFASPATVKFGGVAATAVTVNSSTKITATVPTAAPTGKISVTTSGGTATSSGTFTVVPGIYLSATSGPPTTVVTVKFSGFSPYEAADVYVDNTDTTLVTTDGNGTSGAAGTTVTIPASASPGTHWISVVGRHSGYAVQKSFLVRTNWATVDDNAGRTGVNKYENTLSSSNVGQLDEAWRSASTGSSTLTGGPVVYNGVVYATFRDFTARAFSLATGAQLWSHTTADNAAYAPAVGLGLVFVIDRDSVVALSASTGSVVWTRDLGAEVIADPILYGSAVYVSAGSSVYDLAAASGAVTWSTAVGADAFDPTVSGGRVFVVTDSSDYLVALSASTGGILWSDPLNVFITASTTVSGGFVYASLDNGKVLAMRTDNGSLVWTYTHPDGTGVNSAAVAGGNLYLTDESGSVFSLSASTGASRWSVTPPFGTIAYARPSFANGVLYVNNTLGTFAYSTYGSLLWSVRETGYYYSPAVVDGSLVAGTSYGNVIRFTVGGNAAPAIARPDSRRLRPTIA
jgi:outer membrane protein assembly factor BamB